MENSQMTESEIKQKRLALLDETAAFYNSENRGVTMHGNCVYFDKITGRSCAIGRKIEDKELCEKMNCVGSIQPIERNAPGLYKQLPSSLTELGSDFLAELQSFHDTQTCWDKNGLTEAGRYKYNRIKKDYCI